MVLELLQISSGHAMTAYQYYYFLLNRIREYMTFVDNFVNIEPSMRQALWEIKWRRCGSCINPFSEGITHGMQVNSFGLDHGIARTNGNERAASTSIVCKIRCEQVSCSQFFLL